MIYIGAQCTIDLTWMNRLTEDLNCDNEMVKDMGNLAKEAVG